MIPELEGACRPRSMQALASAAHEHSAPAAPEPGAFFRSVLLDLRTAERETDAWLQKALGDRVTDPQDMLRLQVSVHRFQMQVELAAKVVDQVSQAVRTLVRGGS